MLVCSGQVTIGVAPGSGRDSREWSEEYKGGLTLLVGKHDAAQGGLVAEHDAPQSRVVGEHDAA
jgi:hypothetical protein